MASARWEITGCRHAGVRRRKAKRRVLRDPISKALKREDRAARRRDDARVERAAGAPR